MTPAIDYSQIEQGSEEWIQARVGKVTASRCADVIATLKRGGESADRARYRSELVSEILTGRAYPQHVTAEMRWGVEQEQFARAAYEMQRDVLVETCGFIEHPEIARFGASPDFLVGDDGMGQIKCPTLLTHLGWILGGVVPLEHCPQMIGELSCTKRAWCDFVSFHPYLPEHLQLFVRRFFRNEQFILSLESEVLHFNAEVDQVIAALPQKPQGIVIAMERTDPDELVF